MVEYSAENGLGNYLFNFLAVSSSFARISRAHGKDRIKEEAEDRTYAHERTESKITTISFFSGHKMVSFYCIT